MYDIITPLKQTLRKSSFADITRWLSSHPDDAAWYLISDYCIGDKGKNNDVVSFSVLLNHDTSEKIKSYINRSAPKDIKSTRKVSTDFLNYINCPVIYNFTFVIPRKSKFLKKTITIKKMNEFFPAFKDIVLKTDANSSFKKGYVDSVIKRITSFVNDFEKSQFNAKLARQIYLIGTLASVIFDSLVIIKNPSNVIWVSDRDAIIQRYDGFIFDFAFFMFVLVHSESISTEKPAITILDKPQFHFYAPTNKGEGFYNEFVRIPDYIAGTMADFDFEKGSFSKDKYHTIHTHSLVNSKNHSIIQIFEDADDIHTRRLKFR